MIVKGLSGLWHIQRLIMRCGCVLPAIMTRQPFRPGMTWHCDQHKKADMVIEDVLPVTLAIQEKLTEVRE